MSTLTARLPGWLDTFARSFATPQIAGIGADLFAGMPADLSAEEREAYLDLVASRAEQVGLVRDAARNARVRPALVVGPVGSPVGPGNNRNRRRVLAKLVLAVRNRLANLARPLIAGAKSLFGWLTGFRRDIATAHGAAAMLAHGTTSPEPGVIARTAKFVARQWGYARNFAGQIATGAHVLGKATLARAAMYADAAWATFMNAQIEVAKLAGKTQARRILGFAESHCRDSTSKRTGETRPGCVELARMGWVPIGEIVPIGQATCLAACHCSVDTRY